MTLRVSGKNLDIGESLRTHVGTRVDFVIAKYSASLTHGHVTIEREGSGFRTDCTLHLDSGAILQVEAEAQDAYASFNMAADRIEKRLRRYRGKLKDRLGAGGVDAHASVADGASTKPRATMATVAAVAPLAAVDGNETAASEETKDVRPIVIAESFDALKEMSVSSAVRELDHTHASVVIFRRVGDGWPNVVYRRADGNIGWIDPALSSKA